MSSVSTQQRRWCVLCDYDGIMTIMTDWWCATGVVVGCGILVWYGGILYCGSSPEHQQCWQKDAISCWCVCVWFVCTRRSSSSSRVIYTVIASSCCDFPDARKMMLSFPALFSFGLFFYLEHEGLCGPGLVSSAGDAGCSESGLTDPECWLIPRSHKGCCLLGIAGRWPWRLEPAKECVTTHLPKRAAPKMDGAQASVGDPSRSTLAAVADNDYKQKTLLSRRRWQ